MRAPFEPAALGSEALGRLEDSQASLVLFDIDGTLLSTRAGSRSMERAGREIWGAAFSLTGIPFAGSLDPLIVQAVAERAGFSIEADRYAAFRSAFLREITQDLADPTTEVRVMPGVVALISELRSRSDVVLGLLTGNYGDTGRAKLRAASIDPAWFELSAWGDEAPSRAELVRSALGRVQALDPARAIVIGDTPRDVECARDNGCRSLAVATGRFSRAELLAAGADIAVEDLSDPSVLIEML